MELAIVLVADAENPNVGDLRLRGGSFVFTEVLADEVAQRLRMRLLFLRGEWYLDTREGIPYFDVVFEKGTTEAEWRAIFAPVILGTLGVQSLTSLTFDVARATRQLSIAFVAVLTDGTIFRSTDYGPFIVGG